MNTGCLKLMVLKELAGSSLSGYALLNSLEPLLGRKPSAGSIYPLLNELLENGLVTVKDEGRKRVYSLTKKGKRSIDALLKEKEEIFWRHMEVLRSCHCKDDKALKDFVSLMDGLKEHADMMLPNLDVWADLRTAVIKTLLSPDYDKKESSLRKTLQDTVRKLESLHGEGIK